MTVFAFAILGLVIGGGYFVSLERAVGLYVRDGCTLWLAALQLGRIGAATALFAIVAQAGITPLLASFGGFLVARSVAVRAVRRRA